MRAHQTRSLAAGLICGFTALAASCAVTYVDRKTGATIVQGFVRVRVTPVQTRQPFTVTDVSSVGLSISARSQDHSVVLGYSHTQMVSASPIDAGSLLLRNGIVACLSPDDSCIADTTSSKKHVSPGSLQ